MALTRVSIASSAIATYTESKHYKPKPSTFVEGMAQKLLLDIKLSVQSTSSSLCPKGHRVAARPSLAGSFVFVKAAPALQSFTAMDKQGVEFHVAQDDFFGSLATVLSLYSQQLKRRRFSPREIAEGLCRKSEELDYLQKHYRITKQTPSGETSPCATFREH